MSHPLVEQLHFARSEFRRCLAGVSEEDARKRILPFNSLSWIVGHLANQEQHYWLRLAQGRSMVAGLNELVGSGRPASTPPLHEMWIAWEIITGDADTFLETLTPQGMLVQFQREGQPAPEDVGTLLLRNIFHYWFHTGEAHAIRQALGHSSLPQFVGNMAQARYRPEDSSG